MTIDEALQIVKAQPELVREAFAVVAENQEAIGSWGYTDDDGSYWEDSLDQTLEALAKRLRKPA